MQEGRGEDVSDGAVEKEETREISRPFSASNQDAYDDKTTRRVT